MLTNLGEIVLEPLLDAVVLFSASGAPAGVNVAARRLFGARCQQRWLADGSVERAVRGVLPGSAGARCFAFEQGRVVGVALHMPAAGVAAAALYARPVCGLRRVPPEWIITAFGTSKAEAQLASALCAGSTVTAYARSAGVAPSTCRSHLKRLFAKTGTRRQAELVARILSSLPAVASNGG